MLELEREGLKKVKEGIKLADVVYLMDTECISESTYTSMCSLLGDSVKDLGMTVQDCPLPPLFSVQAAQKEYTKKIITKHNIEYIPGITKDNGNGYMACVKETVQSVIATNNHTTSFQEVYKDTLTLTCALDKCPFLQNGRGVMFAHLEDMTKLKGWRQGRILPKRVKSDKDSWLLLAAEMKDETHAVYEVRITFKLCSFCMRIYQM